MDLTSPSHNLGSEKVCATTRLPKEFVLPQGLVSSKTGVELYEI